MRTRLLAFSLLALGCASVAQAAWPYDPTVNVPVSLVSEIAETAPCAVLDDAGGAIIAWRNRGLSFVGISAQRISPDDQLLWGTGGVSLCDGGAYTYVYPKIVTDGAGGAIVVWYSYGDAGAMSIFAQRISAAGAAQWPACIPLIATTGFPTSTYDPLAAAADGAGGVIVAWGGTGTPGVFAQRISGDGTPSWTEGGVALSGGVSGTRPRIASDNSGGAIVTWYQSGNGNDIRAQRISAQGVAQWTAAGVAICVAASDQINPDIVTDEAHGAILCWADHRGGTTYDIYGQRVSAGGTVLWPADGVPLSMATGNQSSPRVASDDKGGAIVAWLDSRTAGQTGVYAQQVSGAGVAGWTADGVFLASSSTVAGQRIVPDGAGGAIVAWSGGGTGVDDTDIRAQRVGSDGTILWTSGGDPVCTAARAQGSPDIVQNGTHGALVTWADSRELSYSYDLYAQRVGRWGRFGDAQPAIVSVKDVPNDQGHYVTVSWAPSPYDTPIGSYTSWVNEYRIYRRDPGQAAWTLVRTSTAQYLPGYSAALYLPADSTAGSNPRTSFRVDAYCPGPGATWSSDPDSGYAVDNLSPPVPASFSGTYAAGTATLEWDASDAPDLAGYRLYRGGSADFAPQPACLLVEQAGTGYVDAAGGPSYYKLTAVDVNGNEGAIATLLPAGTADAQGNGAPNALALSPPMPNPLRGSATLRLALPREAHVRLAVFDQQGRHVRTLAAGDLPSGVRPVVWDGRGEDGHTVASAIYFVRLEAEGRVITRRLAVVR